MTTLFFAVSLCTLMEEHLRPAGCTVRAPIPSIMHVAIALNKLGTCTEYLVISNQFGIHKKYYEKFIFSAREWSNHRSKIKIKVPNEDEASQCAQRFEEKYHIP